MNLFISQTEPSRLSRDESKSTDKYSLFGTPAYRQGWDNTRYRLSYPTQSDTKKLIFEICIKSVNNLLNIEKVFYNFENIKFTKLFTKNIMNYVM